MPNSKKADTDPASQDQQKLEQRVDAMMDPHAPDAPVPAPADKSAKATEVTNAEEAPIDIFSAPSTAPEVGSELAKEMDLERSKATPDKPQEAVKELSPEPAKTAVANDTVAEPAETAKPADDITDDAATDKAVDEIVSKEGDEVLAAADAKKEPVAVPKESVVQKMHNFFAAWWQHKWARYGTIVALLAVVAGVALWPTSRYQLLNTAGVRSRASLTILDNTTKLPLKNATVTLGTVSAVTDKTGKVTLANVKLGSQVLTIKKTAFAPISKTIIVGWGSNPLGTLSLTAAGDQYNFKIVDYVSGQPVPSAELTSSDANAEVDTKGQAVLTINNPNTDSFTTSVSASNYRTEKVSVQVGSTATITVQLVPSRKDVFISKQSGTYDVYKVDLDGKNKQVVLAGTGNENSQLSLIENPTEDEAALVSTRDNIRDGDGYLEQALTLINVTTGTPLTVDHSDSIQLVDWIGNKLIYAKVRPGASAANPSRYQLMSYDFKNAARVELAHANYFNSVISMNGTIYFATSNNYDGGDSQFLKINPDNTGKQVVLDHKEVWSVLRTDYNTLALSTATGWYTYKDGASQATTSAAAPANTSSNRVYIDSSDGKQSLWVDNRDGKGVLLLSDLSNVSTQDKVLVTQAGLGYPVRWLNSTTVIYRVVTPQETADYVVSANGAPAKKITDVTNAVGLNGWSYY